MRFDKIYYDTKSVYLNRYLYLLHLQLLYTAVTPRHKFLF